MRIKCVTGLFAIAAVMMLSGFEAGNFPEPVPPVVVNRTYEKVAPSPAVVADFYDLSLTLDTENDRLIEKVSMDIQNNTDSLADTVYLRYNPKAGLIETPQRGRYRITEEGQMALSSGEKIDLNYLERYEPFKSFHSATTEGSPEVAEDASDESPMEVLDAAFKQVNATLASELMDEVMKLSPSEFEKLVVKLLLKMGYGSGIDEAGMVTQQSNDGGIDGIIKEDQLGFSNIYIQAKQWATDQTVGKPEIQKFVGALTGQQAQKGLFITTAKFSSGALQYAGNLLGTKVVLVDGNALTRLMIKHNVGVSVEHVYEVKRLDSDFFADEL